MWSKSLFATIKVRIKGRGRGFFLWCPLALFPITGLLLSFDPLLSLFPGKWGELVQGYSDTAKAVLYALGDCPPQKIVDISIEKQAHTVLVQVNTWGIFEGEGR